MFSGKWSLRTEVLKLKSTREVSRGELPDLVVVKTSVFRNVLCCTKSGSQNYEKSRSEGDQAGCKGTVRTSNVLSRKV